MIEQPPFTTRTTIEMGNRTITHHGTIGVTLTGQREGERIQTLIEWSTLELDEMREMVSSLLCLLEEKAGEPFVASCFGRYAEEMGKQFMSEGNGRKLVILRG